jgi:hypothetical protein
MGGRGSRSCRLWSRPDHSSYRERGGRRVSNFGPPAMTAMVVGSQNVILVRTPTSHLMDNAPSCSLVSRWFKVYVNIHACHLLASARYGKPSDLDRTRSFPDPCIAGSVPGLDRDFRVAAASEPNRPYRMLKDFRTNGSTHFSAKSRLPRHSYYGLVVTEKRRGLGSPDMFPIVTPSFSIPPELITRCSG